MTKPVMDVEPGDILLMRFTRHPQHLAIVGDRGAPFFLAGLTTGLALLGAITLILVYGLGWRLLAAA
jgi:hypothetical protein